MDYELDVIDKSNYTSYFLIVWDFLKTHGNGESPSAPAEEAAREVSVAYLFCDHVAIHQVFLRSSDFA